MIKIGLCIVIATTVCSLFQLIAKYLIKNERIKLFVEIILFVIVAITVWLGYSLRETQVRQLSQHIIKLEIVSPKITADGRMQVGDESSYLSIPLKFSKLISKAKSLYQEKRYVEIRPIAQELISQKFGFGYFILALEDLDSDRLDNAEKQLYKAIEIGLGEKDLPYAYVNLANVEIKRKNWERAKAHLEKALSLDPSLESVKKKLETIRTWEEKRLMEKYSWKP